MKSFLFALLAVTASAPAYAVDRAACLKNVQAAAARYGYGGIQSVVAEKTQPGGAYQLDFYSKKISYGSGDSFCRAVCYKAVEPVGQATSGSMECSGRLPFWF